MLIFSVVEGFFGILFITFQWLVCDFYQHKNMRPTNFCLWYLLLWIPLIFAPIWAAKGTYFALPSSLEPLDNPNQRWFLRPAFFNFLGLAVPTSLAISIFVPAIVANGFYRTAYHEQLSYLETYATATQLSQDMVQDAQRVWYDVLKAIRIVNITFILWTFWALCMCLSYSYVSWRLISAISNQLKASKDPMSSARQWQQEQEQQKQIGRAQSQTSNSISSAGALDSPAMLGNAPLPQPSSLQKLKVPVRSKKVRTPKDNFYFTEAEMENDTLSTSFFPPVRPSRFFHTDRIGDKRGGKDLEERMDEEVESGGHHHHQQPQEQEQEQSPQSPRDVSFVSTSNAPTTKRSELRGAYIHLWIQFAAISPACFLFALAACSLGAGSYGLYEQPKGTDLNDMGVKFERLFICELIAKIWITCVFGTVTLTAIVVKTYEHAFVNLTIKVPVVGLAPTRKSNTFSPAVINPTGSSFFETRTRDDRTADNKGGRYALRKQDSDLVPLKEVAESPSSPTAGQPVFSTPSMLSSHSPRASKPSSPDVRAPAGGHVNEAAARNQGGVWYRLWEP